MIRMRFVALTGAFVLLLAGYATYATYLRPAPPFVGATEATHVAAVKSLIAALPAPAGTTLDPYGTWCDAASAACWTSTTEQPKALVSALSKTIVAQGGRVRSHECFEPATGPIDAPDGACGAVIDYHGSRLEVTASIRGKSDNGGRTFLRLDSPRVNPIVATKRPLGAWESVNPLPAVWTTAVTCRQPVGAGCHSYEQRSTGSPVIALPLVQVCAGVRASLQRHHFFFDMDELKPATASSQTFCRIVAHRFDALGGKEGELVFVGATSVDAGSTTLSFHVSAD